MFFIATKICYTENYFNKNDSSFKQILHFYSRLTKIKFNCLKKDIFKTKANKINLLLTFDMFGYICV